MPQQPSSPSFQKSSSRLETTASYFFGYYFGSKKQPIRSYFRWSTISLDHKLALSGASPITIYICPHFAIELVHILQVHTFPITQPTILSNNGFFNYIQVNRFSQTAEAFRDYLLVSLGITVEWIFAYKHERSESKRSYFISSAPDRRSPGFMWGTLTQHGHQAIVIDNNAHYVTSCLHNPILRKETLAW